MKRWLDIILVCLSIVFIFLGASESKKAPLEVDVKCNVSTAPLQISSTSLPSLKPFSHYKTAIIGKLLPQEDVKDKKNVVTDKTYNFLLMGTVQIGEKKGAVFYLKKERKCQPYKLGEEIDGWKIADIQAGKVILESGDRKEEIRVTNEKVSCSRVRVTSKSQSNTKAVVLSASTYKSGKTKETQSIKATFKKTPITSNKGKMQTQPKSPSNTHSTHPVKNPFLEIFKKARERSSSGRNVPAKNPFLKLLKKH